MSVSRIPSASAAPMGPNWRRRRCWAALLALAVAAGGLAPAALASVNAWEDGFGLVGADGPVYAASVGDNSLIVGGDIDVIGGASVGSIASWDGFAWHGIGDPFNGAVRAIVEQDGQVYAAGEFTKALFANMFRVARWNGSKWSALGTGIQGPAQGTRVNSIAFFQGNLYAAGNFTKAGGVNAIDIAYWDGAAWHSIGDTNTDAELHDLAVYGDRLCVAGSFTQIGSLTTKGVACWTGTAWQALGTGLNGGALAIKVHGGDLFVGGSFTFAGGVSTGKVARWNGSAWQSVSYPLTQSVNSLGSRGSSLVVGTNGGDIRDPAKPWLIEWNGTLWISPLQQPDGLVHALTTAGADILVAGAFPRAADLVLGGVGLWTGFGWTALVEAGQRGLQGFAQAFASWNGHLYAAGTFKAAGQNPATLVARWDADHWEVVGNTNADSGDSVDALLAADDGLYAGGKFVEIGGTEAANVARWDGLEWSAVGEGTDGRVRALASVEGDVYAGGSFLHVGETEAAHLAAWDGNSWAAVGSGTDADVRALALFDGDLVAGGDFAMAGGLPAAGVARWDGIAWSALGAGLTGAVHALHVHDEELYAGGAVTASGPTPVSGIAKWSGSSWLALGSGVREGNAAGVVNAMATAGPTLFVGGSFDSAGDVDTRQIARYDGGAWRALRPGFQEPRIAGSEDVHALFVHDSALWLGGSFVRLSDGRPAARVIAWQGCAAGNEAACATSTTTTTSTTLPDFVCGDANDDGEVSASDALLALRTAVGSDECDDRLCDTNDSGDVTAADALAILRYAVGQPQQLDCPLA